MIKYILLLVILLGFSPIFSQEKIQKTINLEWNNKKKVDLFEGESIQTPVVKGQNLDLNKRIPRFIKRWEIPFNTKIEEFTISNLIYENVSKEALLDINTSNLPNNHQTSLKALSTRNKSHAYLTLTPLIKEKSKYKRLTSFVISYSYKNELSKSTKSYVSNSVLASGQWYKFRTNKTGVYKLDYNFIKAMGIAIDAINPKNISIYGNGAQLLPYRIGDFRHDDLQENAIYIKGEGDNSFNTDDYILLFAKGPDNWVHENTIESVKHQKNIYTDYAYYFVHIGDQMGKRVQNANIVTDTPATEFTNFDDFIVHEIEDKNISQMGQVWVGEDFDLQNERDIQMSFDNVNTTFPLKIKTRAVAISSGSTMNVNLNGQNLYTLVFSSISTHVLAKSDTETSSTTVNSSNLNFHLSYNGNAAAKAYLDYIEIIGKKKLIVQNKQFMFRNFDMLTSNDPFSFQIENQSNIFRIWDITDPINPTNISNQGSGSNFQFTANGGLLHEFVVLNEQDFYAPEQVVVPIVSNQNLHALENVDYVIIARADFVNSAEALAQYHRNNSNLNVKVVPLNQIYNEFGSGAPDITAIRDFTKFLYDTSQPHLQYILLYGDMSYDFKNKEGAGENIVPAFHSILSHSETSSFVTDDYYAIVSDPDEGDIDYDSSTQDVAIGRFPVRNLEEADGLTNKTLNYYSNNAYGDWRNQIIMMADDIDKPSSDTSLQTDQEVLSDLITENKALFNIKKLYADAYLEEISSGGSRYPDVNRILTNSVEKGVLMVNYFGHGGEEGLASESLLSTEDIDNYHNSKRMPLFVVISCEFARLDNHRRPNTAGEKIIRNPNGGAAHLIATARAVYISNGRDYNNAITPLLMEFNNESKSISENLRLTKNNFIGEDQRFFVFSLGDPAMHLAIPKPDIRLTHMNDVPITEPMDTIKALSHVSFKGVITNQTGTTLTNFNGVLATSLYDKPIDRETLNNGGNASIMTFDTQDSKIFNGTASITNGEFSFEFVTPQDIRIAYGNGKLSFYADNQQIDKGGYNLDVIVGGINEDAPEDSQGPGIKLYLNDKSFIDGSTTNQSPLLLAFFEDENGINTSLTSVDHDIVATIDGNVQKSIILNDYYTTEMDTYKKGGLEYRLLNLDVGPHTLHLKAYDTYNNMSEATLNFVVLDDNDLVLENVLNYPNPFVNYTEFWFSHNHPNESLEVQIQIFTVSGKLVKTINQFTQTNGALSREIYWDGLDDFGNKIGKGVYIYKLKVTTSISNITAEKYEKLVILQ